MNWNTLANRWKSSVVHIICERDISDKIKCPYGGAVAEKHVGNGFVIDINNGWILTNATLVHDAINIYGSSHVLHIDKLSMGLIAINARTQMALCQLDENSIKKMKNSVTDEKILDVKFASAYELDSLSEYLCIYTNGEAYIEYEINRQRHFETQMSSRGKYINQNSSDYIVLRNSSCPPGAPIFNHNGQVIAISGINKTIYNIAYLLSAWNDFMDEQISESPEMAFDWSPGNADMIASVTDKDATGIYVTEVWPNSPFENLRSGDVIIALNYNDNIDSINKRMIDLLNDDSKIVPGQPRKIQGIIDNHGYLTLQREIDGVIDERPLVNRKVPLNEVWDFIPNDSEVQLILYRNKQLSRLKAKKRISKRYVVPRFYINFQPLVYEIIAGMCITPLVLNHEEYFQSMPHIQKYVSGKRRYKNYLIISNVYSNSTLGKRGDIRPGDILHEVNNREVRSIEDLQLAIQNTDKYITISTKSDSVIIISRARMIQEDTKIITDHNIENYEYILT